MDGGVEDTSAPVGDSHDTSRVRLNGTPTTNKGPRDAQPVISISTPARTLPGPAHRPPPVSDLGRTQLRESPSSGASDECTGHERDNGTCEMTGVTLIEPLPADLPLAPRRPVLEPAALTFLEGIADLPSLADLGPARTRGAIARIQAATEVDVPALDIEDVTGPVP